MYSGNISGHCHCRSGETCIIHPNPPIRLHFDRKTFTIWQDSVLPYSAKVTYFLISPFESSALNLFQVTFSEDAVGVILVMVGPFAGS